MGLSDGDHLRNLLGTYCDRMDAGDLEGVGALFAHASLVDHASGHVLATGAEAVAAYYGSITRRYDGGGLRTKHLVANTVLEEVDGGIVARSSYLVLQATEDLPLQPIITGRYVDRFERHDGAWRWVERAFLVDQLGDLRRHLRFDLA